MQTKHPCCPVCKGHHVIKFGLNRQGKQRYRCRSVECSRKIFLLDYRYKGHEFEIQQKIVEMALNGSGVRETGRALGISYNTVTAQLKKRAYIARREHSVFDTQ